jgi:4-hydroxybenzoate-CoA ligase/benzoate-CoA ligase
MAELEFRLAYQDGRTASSGERSGESVAPEVDPYTVPREFNAAAHFIDRHLTEGRAEKTALIDDAGAYSYAQIAARVNRFGNMLHRLGVAMEQRVMVCLVDGVDFPSAFFGAIKSGVVPVPVSTLLTPAEYAYMMRDTRAPVIVASAPLLERLGPALAEQPFVRAVLVAGADDGGAISRMPASLRARVRNLHQLIDESPDSLKPADTVAEEVAFWLYSSGSTGPPKAAAHRHESLLHTAILYGDRVLGIRETDVVFSAAKMFFAYGLGNSLTFPLHVGATAVVTAQRPTPASVMQVMSAHGPTIFYGVPTLFASILADPTASRTQGSARLRVCVSAGEALPADLGKRWRERFGVDILDGIGSTEILHIFISNRLGDVRYGTSGKPVPGYTVRVLDDHGNEVADADVGDLWCRGPSICSGYWNNRAASTRTFVGEWIRTGDKYTREPYGYFRYVGRSDDMLKVSGMWVSPFEVESALAEHPAVLEAAVVGRNDADNLIKPMAFVVLKKDKQGSPALADELRAFVKQRLAPYKYPRWIVFRAQLPKTATGKIQRFKLRDLSVNIGPES